MISLKSPNQIRAAYRMDDVAVYFDQNPICEHHALNVQREGGQKRQDVQVGAQEYIGICEANHKQAQTRNQAEISIHLKVKSFHSDMNVSETRQLVDDKFKTYL